MPVVPGSDGADRHEAEALELAERIGFPVLIKAVAGGGGRGMTVVARRRPSSREACAHGPQRGPGRLRRRPRLSREVSRPAAPHRDPAARRRPAATSSIWASATARCSAATRRWSRRRPRRCSTPRRASALGGVVADAPCASSAIASVGTVEFLYEDGEFYFIEMNTRAAGRASGDRAGHRHRSRARADQDRRRPAAELHAEGRPLPGPRDRVPDQRRGPAHAAADARQGGGVPRPGRARACGSIRRSTPATRCRPTTTA